MVAAGMELLFLVFTLLVAAAVPFWCFLRNGNRRGLKMPPGRRGLPLIGDTIPFMKPHPSSRLGEYLENNMKQYGRIFRTSILGKPTVVSLDPDFNKFVLQNEGKLFLASYPKSITEILGRWSMLATVGDVHGGMRSIAANFMNTTKLKTCFLPYIDRQAARILDSWKDRSTLSAVEEGKKFAFNLMVRHLMSMEPGMPDTERLREEYTTFMRGMAAIPVKIPGTAYSKALNSRSTILEIMGQKLDERMMNSCRVATTTDDQIDGEEEEDDLLEMVVREKSLDREQILDLLLSMLFAGHETSSAAIALALYFLPSCSKALRQLREEHLQILRAKREGGRTKLNWDDYKRMEFTQCVINETLRLGNIVKYLHRKATTNVQYREFDVPSGMEVIVILPAVHLDALLFEDPQTFNPWRWQGPKPVSKNYLMPFSGGPRLCPGAELARLEIAVFVHHLVLSYDWELDEPDHPVSFPFLGFPKHLPINIHHFNYIC